MNNIAPLSCAMFLGMLLTNLAVIGCSIVLRGSFPRHLFNGMPVAFTHFKTKRPLGPEIGSFGYFPRQDAVGVIIHVIHRGRETSPPQTNTPPLQAQ